MDFSVDEKIKLASEKCDNNYANSFRFSAIYPFTTENIKAYLSLFNLKDKSLFTVGSSGDQALNAILSGSNDITVFDICPFAREYFYLKRAAIQTFTMDDFLRFFCLKDYPKKFFNNKHVFDAKAYLKISEVLKIISDETEYFWTEMFRRYNGITIRKQLFIPDGNDFGLIKNTNNYLNSVENYIK